MIEILQKPDSFCFSSGLKDIIVRSDKKVICTFTTEAGIFLYEYYIPDADNMIYVRELDKLFLPYISKTELRTRFILSVFDSSGNGEALDITVQYGLAGIDIPASEFLASNFLTVLKDEKTTALWQKEYLSLVVSEATEVTAKVRYLSGEYVTKTLGTINETNKVITLDVSPTLFDNPENIAYYVIIAGNRVMTYYIDSSLHPSVQFVFLNSFGVKETYIPGGLILRENKYENQFGSFAGKYKKYNIDLIKQYTANTGVLSENTADWLEEIFVSKDVFLLSSAGIENEVVIEEATVKRSFAQEELPAFEFKYRLSKTNQHEYSMKKTKIFDGTFDYTFN